MLYREDAKSQTTTYTYNDRNNLTNVTYPNSTYVSYSYDDAGRQTQMVDSTGTTGYSYTNLNQLSSVTFPGSKTVGYGYDDAGREISVTYPGGTNQVAYTYDAANRLSTVTDWNTNQTVYSYDDANRMTTTTLPNGVVGTSSYDNANRLTGVSWAKGGTTLASASYTLDNVGNRTARTDLAGTESYGYDNAYRLTSVTYPGPATTTYAYDAFGNRTSLVDGSGTTTTAYNDASEISSVTPPSPASPVSYTYDANGNVTNRGGDTFAWDFENRLTSTTVGGTTTSFTYRGDGLRASQTTGSTTTSYTWDLNGSLPVVLDDGSQYVYGNGLVSQVSGASTYYYLTDGLGSTMATTDASGSAVNGYTYDVYGKTTASSGSQPNSIQFAGQQTDATGLQYLRARYYDPSTGTFLSRDPLSAKPTWSGSPFGYVAGNPVNASDPFGKAGCLDGDPSECFFDASGPGMGPGGNPENVRVGNPTPEIPQAEPEATAPNEAGPEPVATAEAPSLTGEKPDWPTDPGQVQHIFDNKPGHVNPQSAAEREAWIRTFKEVASDPANLREDLSKHPGIEVTAYYRTLEDGSQVWVEVANGKISDAGLNTPGMAR